MSKDKEKLHKLQVNISKDTLREIDEVKKRIDAGSRKEVIKASLKYFSFVTKEKNKDKELKVLLEDSKGNKKEIIIFIFRLFPAVYISIIRAISRFLDIYTFYANNNFD